MIISCHCITLKTISDPQFYKWLYLQFYKCYIDIRGMLQECLLASAMQSTQFYKCYIDTGSMLQECLLASAMQSTQFYNNVILILEVCYKNVYWP